MNKTSQRLQETSHSLYSRGYVYDDFDYFDALKQISELVDKSPIQVQERILCCRTRRLKSSTDLKKLIALETKFKGMGLDVYIKVH